MRAPARVTVASSAVTRPRVALRARNGDDFVSTLRTSATTERRSRNPIPDRAVPARAPIRILTFATIALLAACGGNEKRNSGGTGSTTDAADAGTDAPISDVGGTETGGTDAGFDAPPSDAGPDAPEDVSPDLGFDVPEDVFREDTLPDVVEPERPDDWLCNRDARVAACDSPLIDPSPAPEDPSELLFYVNRWNQVPDDYPIPSGSTWTPCDAPDGPDVPHDLVCIPDRYASGPPRALRQVAWSSPAPTDRRSTWDGRPVGFNGRVGFEAMFQAARAEAGVDLFVVSGFRSHATQEGLHEYYVEQEMADGATEEQARILASTYSARPGHSEHQLGTTADLTYRTETGSVFQGLDQIMGASTAFQWVFRNAHRFGIVLTYDAHRVVETQYVYEPWHFRYVGVDAADAMNSCALNTEELLAERYGADDLPPYEGYDAILYHDLELLEHVSLGPGAWVAPGERVTSTWRVRNAGSINWWRYTLARIGGDAVDDSVIDIACVPANRETELSITFDAPSIEGTYESEWQVFDDGGVGFDDTLSLDFTVSSDPPPEREWRWIRIDDVSEAVGGGDPGADIDAIVVDPGAGETYATRVTGYAATPASVVSDDPDAALGAPDAFDAWPDVSTCRVDTGFVSLGGTGFLVVEVANPLETGDRIAVLEVGGCDFGSGTAILDDLDVFIGSSAEGPWVPAGTGVGPRLDIRVPALP